MPQYRIFTKIRLMWHGMIRVIAMRKFLGYTTLILCCFLALLLTSCGAVSIEKSLEKIAMDNGNFTNIDIHSSQYFYEVILDCVEYPTEEQCDDLAAKMFKKAYSKDYEYMNFNYIEIVIGEDSSNMVHGDKHFESIAHYRLYRTAIHNIDMENIDNLQLARLSNKQYRKAGSREWYRQECYYRQEHFTVK